MISLNCACAFSHVALSWMLIKVTAATYVWRCYGVTSWLFSSACFGFTMKSEHHLIWLLQHLAGMQSNGTCRAMPLAAFWEKCIGCVFPFVLRFLSGMRCLLWTTSLWDFWLFVLHQSSSWTFPISLPQHSTWACLHHGFRIPEEVM